MMPYRVIRACPETLIGARWLVLGKRLKHVRKCGEIWEGKGREVRLAELVEVVGWRWSGGGATKHNFLLFEEAQSQNILLCNLLLLPARTPQALIKLPPLLESTLFSSKSSYLLATEAKLTSFSDRLGRRHQRSTRHISPTTYFHLLQTPPKTLIRVNSLSHPRSSSTITSYAGEAISSQLIPTASTSRCPSLPQQHGRLRRALHVRAIESSA